MDLLADLAAEYRAITDQWLRTPAQRNYLASAYRVHGPQLLAIVRSRFDELQTTVNLLGIVRATDPDDFEPAAAPSPVEAQATTPTAWSAAVPDHPGRPCPIEQCIPNVVYCPDHRPNGVSPKQRWDRFSWTGYRSVPTEPGAHR